MRRLRARVWSARARMSRLRLERLSRRYGDFLAVDDVSLDVADGEFVTLLGPSGCGKTTTLRMVAGFIAPDGGSILFDDARMNDVPPHRRNTAMVFQSYALFPHMTVAENVAFGLRMRKLPKAEQAASRRGSPRHGEPARTREATSRASCPADSSSVSLWHAPSPRARTFCCSTSRCRTSTPSCAKGCASKSASCSGVSASPLSMSRTTRPRRSPSPTGSSS